MTQPGGTFNKLELTTRLVLYRSIEGLSIPLPINGNVSNNSRLVLLSQLKITAPQYSKTIPLQ
ncbi:MAG: hypothetical protein QGG87_01795 [Nitrospinota bacterium]|nr:hypothetical protein [Nitrospinota bacterium]